MECSIFLKGHYVVGYLLHSNERKWDFFRCCLKKINYSINLIDSNAVLLANGHWGSKSDFVPLIFI